MAYADRVKSRVEQLRAQWWPNRSGKPKHPDRWTGRDLATDARAADKLLDEGFEAFYRLRHAQLCWSLHGSGLAGVANVPPEVFPMLGGFAYRDAAAFGRVVSEVVSRAMGTWDQEEFRDLRVLASAAAEEVFARTRNGVGGLKGAPANAGAPSDYDFSLDGTSVVTVTSAAKATFFTTGCLQNATMSDHMTDPPSTERPEAAAKKRGAGMPSR